MDRPKVFDFFLLAELSKVMRKKTLSFIKFFEIFEPAKYQEDLLEIENWNKHNKSLFGGLFLINLARIVFLTERKRRVLQKFFLLLKSCDFLKKDFKLNPDITISNSKIVVQFQALHC